MSKTLRILADENIPLVREAFSGFGDVTTCAGRTMTAADVDGIDVLLVRSVTHANATLLKNSSVRFVGTATIGVDHIDQTYLNSNGIHFVSCPGSNAESVACYVTCALLELADHVGITLAGKTLGVIGVGNVGRRVVAKGHALGMTIMRHDPPRANNEGVKGFSSLADVVANADILTLHTPLTISGPYPTAHMIDARVLAKAKQGCLLLNTGRGGAVDERALKDALHTGQIAAVALDVWADEPNIDAETLKLAHIGTPHIAGYAIDGKIRGTTMLAEGLSRWLAHTNPWDPEPWLARYPTAPVVVHAHTTLEDGLRQICRGAYAIAEDDARLRQGFQNAPDERGATFDRLRKTYPVRREFDRITVQAPKELQHQAKALGFCLCDGTTSAEHASN